LSGEAIIDRVVSRVRVMDGAGGLSAEAVRSIVEAVLPAVEEMLAHSKQVQSESSTRNGYLDRMERGDEL
jgi:hypothetical protein